MSFQKTYSTGTKGRLEKHADECKTLIRAKVSPLNLANEFILSLDPTYDNTYWQKYGSPSELIPKIQEWLGEPVTHTAEVKTLKAEPTIPLVHPRKPEEVKLLKLQKDIAKIQEEMFSMVEILGILSPELAFEFEEEIVFFHNGKLMQGETEVTKDNASLELLAATLKHGRENTPV